jgi:SAM-dependent methyltransferase
MTAQPSLHERLLQLFDHLGFARAHIGYTAPRDLTGLLRVTPDSIASVAVAAARTVDIDGLAPLDRRLLFIRGDGGSNAPAVPRALTRLPGASVVTLHGYEDVVWGDIMGKRANEAGEAMLDHLAAAQAAESLPPVSPDEREGWVGDIWFRVDGSGPPLVLFPIALSPSQWEPLVSQLSEQYCTVTLGGPLLGSAGSLEERAQMPWYRGMLRNLLAVAEPQPGEAIVEVGCGCGAVTRFVAESTDCANPILGIDINRYLLREARASAARVGLDALMSFQEGSADDLPLETGSFGVTLCVTVLEEGDADRMLSELVRVTKPGGRVAIMVRSVDIPWWINLPLSDSAMAKVVWADRTLVADNGCGDASLVARMVSAGLQSVTMSPQLASQAPGPYSDQTFARMRAELSPSEALEWDRCLAEARAAGTLTMASSYYLAVGMKP